MISKLQKKNFFSKQLCIFISIVFVSFLLTTRMILFVAERGVNLLFWDEWDFLSPLFTGRDDIWTLFTWQHGLHRQGIGFFIIKPIAELSRWNTRVDEFSIVATIIVALICTLLIKRMLWGPFTLSDVILPFLVLNLIQYETIIGTPNISASALPLALVIVYCMCWIIRNETLKYSTIFILNFLMIFTGYALLIAPINLALLAVEIFQNRKERIMIVKKVSFWAFIGSILSIGIFLIGYRFQTGVPCFSFKPSFLLKYPAYISMMFAKFIRLDLLSNSKIMVLGGFVLVTISTMVFALHLWRIIRYRLIDVQQSVIIVILLGYSLFFAISTALGRVCLGVESSLASRYTTLLVPAFIGLYLHIVGISRPNYRRLAFGIVLLIQLVSLFPFVGQDAQIIEFYSTDKENWKRCYLQTGDYSYCNKETSFRIYPNDDERIEKALLFLKNNHLNLFLDDPIK